MRAIILHKFGPPDALIPEEEAPADGLITGRTERRRLHHRSGVLATRMLSLMIALTLACALSSAVNAGDGGNSSKSSADSPDSAGVFDMYLENKKTKNNIIPGGVGHQKGVEVSSK